MALAKRSQDINQFRQQIQQNYDAFKAKGLQLNLTRGKPSPAQLDLSTELLALPGSADFRARTAPIAATTEIFKESRKSRRIFARCWARRRNKSQSAITPACRPMHDAVMYSLLKGTCDSAAPWSRQGEIAFLCPVPGYDRHFSICEDYGIRMISVPLREDGPDMDEVERLVAQDASIRAMWCLPKYSNPTGAIYSDTVIERMAAMKTAAADFRLYWDNAYAVHRLTDERIEIANIIDLCARHGNPNRPFVFASTSKITLAGAGLALFASSPENVKWCWPDSSRALLVPTRLTSCAMFAF